MKVWRLGLLSIGFVLLNYTNSVYAVRAQVNVDSKLVSLSADFNRDGKIEFTEQLNDATGRTDKNTEDKPFVFWVNDDDDDPGSETSGYDIAAQSGFFEFDGQDPDNKNKIIDGSRDLIDFFAVGLDLNKYLNTTQDIDKKTFWLQHDDEAVNIVYTEMSRGVVNGDGLSSDYLKKININNADDIFGKWQTQGQLSDVPVYTVTAEGIELPAEFIELITNDENKGVILVEGNQESVQPLKIIIKDEKGNQILDAALPLRLYNVTRLYRQVSLRGELNNIPRDKVSSLWGVSPTNVMPDVSALLADLSVQSTNIAFFSPEVDINKHVIYVHGFNNNEAAASAFQSETFKRLYHSGSNALFTGVHWNGDEGIPAGVNYWDNVENALYVADDFAALVNGVTGTKNIVAHSLGNMVVGSAIQDFSLGYDKYLMLNPAVALEAYRSTTNAKQMRHPDWDEYYFGSDYDPVAETETYIDQPGRKLWTVEWHTLFADTDARNNLTWRDRFDTVGASNNVIQYYSSGEEVLKFADEGVPDSLDAIIGYLPGNDTPTGLNAWNIQEKSKGTSNLAAFLGGGSSAGWGFNEECVTDAFGEETCVSNGLLSHADAQVFFDRTNDELTQNPFFDPFENVQLTDVNAGSAAVNISFPHDMGYEIPALSYAAGGTRSTAFLNKQIVNMNNEMTDGWPAVRGGENGKAWRHSDFKDVSYRYTYKLFDDLVTEGVLK